MSETTYTSNGNTNTVPMSQGRLRQIFIDHQGYISDKWEHYLFIYEAALARFIADGRPIRLLEIGVQNGGSIQIWSKYLPEGSTIVGIDIDTACTDLVAAPNVFIHIGDASDPVALDRMLGDSCFGVIIDDGSHPKAATATSGVSKQATTQFGWQYRRHALRPVIRPRQASLRPC
jgi:hypothetical protein